MATFKTLVVDDDFTILLCALFQSQEGTWEEPPTFRNLAGIELPHMNNI
jgi:hypothetical protein